MCIQAKGKRGQSPFAGTARRRAPTRSVGRRTNGDCPLFPCRLLWTAAVLFAGIGVAAAVHAAQPDEREKLLQAHIQAGEFAPAMTLARQAADPKQRDAWLSQIARAQAQVGARDASIQSASQIGDDRTRAGALGGASGASGAPTAPAGGQGGASQADFDDLIDLITSTVKPSSWDTVGGPGSIAPFPTGVWVDPHGVLRPLMKDTEAKDLAALRAASGPRTGREDVRRNSPLRMVSLPRLEKQIQLRLAAGQPPTEAMQFLAGLSRIRYVFVYPESGDLVLAGPAGDWTPGPEGAVVNSLTGQPVLRLDDLVVIFRSVLGSPNATFGCRITPREEALARVQTFLQESNKRPIDRQFRGAWLKQLRAQVGKQDIEVQGLDPRTRAAHVIVEADYRMKLVGMGLEEGVPGVVSYLKLIKLGPKEPPPPMTVLRWWFTLNYEAVQTSNDRLAFGLQGQGVKVESENERLTAEGKQVHTDASEAINRQFARSFTQHFEELSLKYPIYGELRNLCDLALVGALVRQEAAADKVGWHLTCFGDPQAFQVQLAAAPKEVDSVVNCRVFHSRVIVAGVSGGVLAAPMAFVSVNAMSKESGSALENQRYDAVPKKAKPSDDTWWWD
jgi:hypothetical protein